MKVSDMITNTKLDDAFSQLDVRCIKLAMYWNRLNVYPLFPKYIDKKVRSVTNFTLDQIATGWELPQKRL